MRSPDPTSDFKNLPYSKENELHLARTLVIIGLCPEYGPCQASCEGCMPPLHFRSSALPGSHSWICDFLTQRCLGWGVLSLSSCPPCWPCCWEFVQARLRSGAQQRGWAMSPLSVLRSNPLCSPGFR